MDFSEDLEGVRSKVLHMGGIVEDQLARSIEALVNGDPSMARSVVSIDPLVNALEVELDVECTAIIAERHPGASDLRLVMAVIKTINDLERIGDEVKRVAKMVGTEMRGALAEDIRLEIEHIGELVRDMLRNVLDAFARTDAHAAVAVARADRRIDIKYQAITRQLMTHMVEDRSAIPVVLNVLWAARALERVGDRCQNIAEYVIYVVLGKDIRHQSLDGVVAELEGI